MPNVQTEYMERGYRGTEKTIDKMHRLIAKGKIHPTLHKIASWIRLSVPQDKRGRTRELSDKLFWFVKNHGIFQSDPFQIERIEHPIEAMRPVIEARQAGTYTGHGLFIGDCDLYTIMLSTLGGLLGFQYSFETVKVDSSRPDEFSHIYPALLVEGKWVAYDASSTNAVPDWRPQVDPEMFRRWPEREIERTLGMSGMNGVGRNGLSDVESYKAGARPGIIPRDYQGYGIPKTIGGEHGHKPYVPPVKMGYMGPLVPREPQDPLAEVAAEGIPEMKKVPPEPASERVENMAGPYLPRPIYEPPKPYYSESHPWDPTWPWARQVQVRYKQPEHYQGEQPSPEEKLIRGAGYGEYIPPAGLSQTREEVVAEIEDLQAKLAAAREAGDAENERYYELRLNELQGKLSELDSAGGSVWDSISGTIDNLVEMVPGVTDQYVGTVRDKYRKKLADAEARVASAEAEKLRAKAELMGGVPSSPTSKPWYSSPAVLLLGGAAVVGGIYFATKR